MAGPVPRHRPANASSRAAVIIPASVERQRTICEARPLRPPPLCAPLQRATRASPLQSLARPPAISALNQGRADRDLRTADERVHLSACVEGAGFAVWRPA